MERTAQRTVQRANEEWQRRKTELPMDRNGTDLFFRLWHSEHSASIALQWEHRWAVVCCGEAPALLVCVWRGQADGVGACRGVFGIPCIPATEHKCPVPDINQLFQEQREGFGLWDMLHATWGCEMGERAADKLCPAAVKTLSLPSCWSTCVVVGSEQLWLHRDCTQPLEFSLGSVFPFLFFCP